MRIAVVGAGGVGGYFGGRLARAGHDVTFIARGEHLSAMLQDGLRVESINGDFTVSPVQATDNPENVGAVDLVVIGVKAWQIPGTAARLGPMLGPRTQVLPLQIPLTAWKRRRNWRRCWVRLPCWAACAASTVSSRRPVASAISASTLG